METPAVGTETRRPLVLQLYTDPLWRIFPPFFIQPAQYLAADGPLS
jgi:hypothetical protein